VYKHPEILAEQVGSQRGKGEALWKSLHVLKGDLIAWVDTDITNIHPRFIYGLLGPLLKRPNIQYVKGFYQRPIKVGDTLQAFGGGRVTELVARPLLNLFYPELSGIIQPLSGEYAGRRTALETLPFFSGYGVETGLLIDMLNLCGLDCIAQADLEERVHHNQPLVGLSKMSFAILQVFIARLESRYDVRLLEHANKTMKLIAYEPDRFALDVEAITDVERPAMVSIPAYAERRTM
jgi:glucosyl-3-phosphoglycerate synthase